jgi:ferric-dicitrate binding protein FerR (iron transport regulator)
MRYLFPCRCGQKHPVQTHQAGQIIQCSCGARLEVPTLRKIVLLEKDATPTQTSKPSRGGVKRRLMVLGFVALMMAVVLGAFVWSRWPTPPASKYDSASIYRETMALTPLQSLQAWEMALRTPLGKLSARSASPAMMIAYQQKRAELESLAVIAAVLAVVALGLMVGAAMMPAGQPATPVGQRPNSRA